MTQYINNFLNLVVSQENSASTTASYASDLKQFNKYVSENINKDIAELVADDLRQFVSSLNNLKASSICRKISSLKKFFDYMFDENIITVNIAQKLGAPKQEKMKPDIMSENDTESVLIACRNFNDDKKTKRDYAILKLLYCTGIRRGELVAIKLNDVNFSANRILINGKGSKQRFVYFNDEIKELLQEYLANIRPEYIKAEISPFLFLSQQSISFTLHSINNIINKYMKLANCKQKGRSVHACRKSFAQKAYNVTGDIYAVSATLGHENINTTKRYTMVDEEKVRAACMAVSF